VRSVIVTLATLTLPALFSVDAATFPSQEFGLITLEERLLQAPTAYPNTGAVVIFDKGFVVTEIKGVQFQRHTRVKIIDESGIDKVTPVVIKCRAYDWIRDVKALIHKPDGRVLEIDEKQTVKFEDKTNRSVTMSFPGLAAGDIFEYTYTIYYYGGVDKLGAEKYFLFSQAISYEWLKERKKKTVDWDEHLYKQVSNLPAWYFDNSAYTLYSELTVKLGSELDYTCVPSNIPVELQHPDVRRGSGIIDRVYKYHTWKMEDIPPTDYEPLMPRPNDYRPSLHFELFSTSGENRIIIGNYADVHWLNVGKNMQGYLNMYVKRPRQMFADALQAVSGLAGAHDKTKRLFDLVRDEYRADGKGYRLRPVKKNLREFYDKKTGAPFELNLLLVEMLKVAGVDAWPVLVSTRDQVDFRRTARFNHMIAYAEIDEGGVFMDASSKACPFGSLPPQCLVKEGLLVNFDQSRLVSVLTADPNSYRRDSVTVQVGRDGSVVASLVTILNGYPAMELGDYLEHVVKGQRDSLQSPVVSDIATWDNLKWRYDSLGRCVAQTRIPLEKLSATGVGGMVLPIMPLLAENPFPAQVRLQPIDFLYPFGYESKVLIQAGERMLLPDSSANASIEIEGASFNRAILSADSTLIVITRLRIDKAEFTTSEYVAVRAFFEQASESCRRTIVLGQ
jgi:hypothetical protein